MNDLQNILNYVEDNAHTLISNGKVGHKPSSISYPRMYLTFILITRHNYTNKDINTIFNVNRSLYYYVLEKIPYLLKDKIFLNHIKTVSTLFPYTEEDIIKVYSLLAKIKEEPKKTKTAYKQKSFFNIFALKEEDIKKLKDNPSMVNIIKQIIKKL